MKIYIYIEEQLYKYPRYTTVISFNCLKSSSLEMDEEQLSRYPGCSTTSTATANCLKSSLLQKGEEQLSRYPRYTTVTTAIASCLKSSLLEKDEEQLSRYPRYTSVTSFNCMKNSLLEKTEEVPEMLMQPSRRASCFKRTKSNYLGTRGTQPSLAPFTRFSGDGH